MQVDPGGLAAATKITASNLTRPIVYSLLVNWARDTSSWNDGNWNDETKYIDGDPSGGFALSLPEDGIASLGQTPAATASFPLQNSAGRFSPNRSDGALYANIRMDGGGNNRGIYTAPVQFWVGFYYSGQATTVTLGAAINTTVGQVTEVITLSANTILSGQIIQVDSEKMLVMTGSTVNPFVVRGFDGTTAATHANLAALTIVGGACRTFTGVIHQPNEASKAFQSVLECLDRTFLLLQHKTSTTISTNVAPHTLITTNLTQLPSSPTYMPVPSAQRALDAGLFPIQYGFMDDESVFVECGKIASADGGYLFFSPRGKLRYWNPQHLLLSEPDTDSISASHTASQYTFDTANMADFSVTYEYDNIYSDVIVEYSPRSIGPLEVIYQMNEAVVIPPATVVTTLAAAVTTTVQTNWTLTAGTMFANSDVMQVDAEVVQITAGGGTVNVTVTRGYNGTTAATHLINANVSKVGSYATTIRFNYPALGVITPVGGALPSGSDVRDHAWHNGGSVDITGSIGLATFTVYGMRADIVLVNTNASYAAFVTKFQVRGLPIKGSPTKQVKKSKTTTPAGIPSRIRTLPANWYVGDEVQASALGDFYGDRVKVGRAIYHLKGAPGVPQLEVGDLITITEATALSASVTAFVLKIKWDVKGVAAGQPLYTLDIDAVDSTSLFASSSFYVVGTTALGSGVCWY